jgi:hypothetical protein
VVCRGVADEPLSDLESNDRAASRTYLVWAQGLSPDIEELSENEVLSSRCFYMDDPVVGVDMEPIKAVGGPSIDERAAGDPLERHAFRAGGTSGGPADSTALSWTTRRRRPSRLGRTSLVWTESLP